MTRDSLTLRRLIEGYPIKSVENQQQDRNPNVWN